LLRSRDQVASRAQELQTAMETGRIELTRAKEVIASYESQKNTLSDQLQQSQKSDADKGARIAEMAALQSRLGDQIKALTESSDTQRARVQSLETTNAALQSKLSEASARQNEILSDLKKKDSELIRQTQTIADLNRQRADYEASLSASHKNSADAQARAAQLESQLNLSAKEAEAVRQAKTSLESVLDGSQREINSLRTRITSTQAELASSQDLQNKLRSEIESRAKEAEASKADYESELRRLSAETLKLREASTGAEAAVHSLQETQRVSMQEINELRSDRARLVAQNENQKSLLDRAESLWKEKFSQAETAWKTRLDEVTARLSQLGSGVNAAREEAEQYRKDIQESKMREAQAQTERIQLNTEIAKADAQMRRERQERESTEAALAQARTAQAAAESELAKLKSEIGSTSSALLQTRDKSTLLEKQNQELQRSRVSAQMQLQSLQQAKSDLEQSLQTSRTGEAAAREEAQKTRAALAQLEADQRQLEADAIDAVQGVSQQSEAEIAQLKMDLAKSQSAFKLLESELETSSKSLSERQQQTLKLEQALEQNGQSIKQFEDIRRNLADKLSASEERARKLEAEVQRLAAEAAKPAVESQETQKMKAELKALQAKLNDSSAVEKSLQMELAVANRAAEQAAGKGSHELPQLRGKIDALEAERAALIEDRKRSEAQKAQLAAQVNELKKSLGQAAVVVKQQSAVQEGLRKKLEISAKNSQSEPATQAAESPKPASTETVDSMSPIGRLSALRALRIMRTDPELMKQNQAPLVQKATATLIISRPENDYLLVSMDHIRGLKEGSTIRLSADGTPIYDAEIRKAGEYDMMTLRITKRHVDAADYSKGQIFEVKEI
ncbi:MAG: hypothetical protein KBD07_02630, partial [Candidatus Omnitrophica bacterium]|nr:hypothetical protein [Candidatus Omnitrophota bacterium]